MRLISPSRLGRDCGVINLTLMDSPQEQSADALQSALRVARENENRWAGMSPEFTSDSERMEQWASTAKLRRLEVERIEALMAKTTGPSGFSPPACNEAVERIDRLGETE
jgi:hypothetical protein